VKGIGEKGRGGIRMENKNFMERSEGGRCAVKRISIEEKNKKKIKFS